MSEANELMQAHQQLERVQRGLKPSLGNQSKQLPRDKELLYTEILQSSNKNFMKLFAQTEENGSPGIADLEWPEPHQLEDSETQQAVDGQSLGERVNQTQ